MGQSSFILRPTPLQAAERCYEIPLNLTFSPPSASPRRPGRPGARRLLGRGGGDARARPRPRDSHSPSSAPRGPRRTVPGRSRPGGKGAGAAGEAQCLGPRGRGACFRPGGCGRSTGRKCHAAEVDAVPIATEGASGPPELRPSSVSDWDPPVSPGLVLPPLPPPGPCPAQRSCSPWCPPPPVARAGRTLRRFLSRRESARLCPPAGWGGGRCIRDCDYLT